MVVFCDGMVRSGSTWSFNVALDLLRSCDPHRRSFGLYSEKPAVVNAAVRRRSSHIVIKSHVLHGPARELCLSRSLKTIYTWRDPYDVIVSCTSLFGRTAEYWSGSLRNALRVWSFHRTTGTGHIISYASIMEKPSETVASIANYLELGASPEQVRKIAERMSARKLKPFAEQICNLDQPRIVRTEGYTFDRQTLLHQNHIRDGRTGYGIVQLDAEQRAMIDRVLVEEGFGFLRNTGVGLWSRVEAWARALAQKAPSRDPVSGATPAPHEGGSAAD